MARLPHHTGKSLLTQTLSQSWRRKAATTINLNYPWYLLAKSLFLLTTCDLIITSQWMLCPTRCKAPGFDALHSTLTTSVPYGLPTLDEDTMLLGWRHVYTGSFAGPSSRPLNPICQCECRTLSRTWRWNFWNLPELDPPAPEPPRTKPAWELHQNLIWQKKNEIRTFSGIWGWNFWNLPELDPHAPEPSRTWPAWELHRNLIWENKKKKSKLQNPFRNLVLELLEPSGTFQNTTCMGTAPEPDLGK